MLRKTAIAMLVATLSVAVLPAPAGAAMQEKTLLDDLRAAMLAESNGDLSMMGTVTQFTPNGEITTEISGFDILAFLERTTIGGVNVAGPAKGGVVAGSAELRNTVNPSWPYCDYASTFNYYYTPAASKYILAQPSLLPPQGTVCGMPAYAWGPVVMDSSSTIISCSAGVIAKPTPNFAVGAHGGYFCSNGAGLAVNNGVGAALAYNFGFLRLDYFMGLNAEIVRATT